MSVRSSARILLGTATLTLVRGAARPTRGVGPQPTPVTLTLAAPFGENPELQPFVDAVSRLSDGIDPDRLQGQRTSG